MQVQQNRSIFKAIENKIHHSNTDHKTRLLHLIDQLYATFFKPYTY